MSALRELLTRMRDVHPDDLPSSLRRLRAAWMGAGAPFAEAPVRRRFDLAALLNERKSNCPECKRRGYFYRTRRVNVVQCEACDAVIYIEGFITTIRDPDGSNPRGRFTLNFP